MSETTHKVTVSCDDCGTDLSVHPQHENAHEHFCDNCHERQQKQQLRDSLDPNHDGVFGRADALKRLKHKGDMPIVDHDGGLITEVRIEHGRGIGAEPNGYWVESITKITDCDECGYEKASQSRKANAGHHPQRSKSCPKCGFKEVEA